MPALILPILIMLGIVGFTAGGDVIKTAISIFLGQPPAQTAPAPSPKPSVFKQAPAPAPRPAPPAQAPPPTPAPAPTPASQNSPYFQKVRISSFRPLSGFNSALATLRPNFSEEQTLNITGWTLKSKWTGNFKIPYAIEQYHPVLNSQSTEPVLVKRSDTLYISSEKSPLGKGRNFRPNQCFAYLKASGLTALPGSSSCYQEKPKVEQISHLSPLCQEFILTKIDYGSCKLPDKGIPSNPDCISYLTELAGSFSYEGCYQKKQAEQNFLANEWYVYIESDFGNLFHDTITLLDKDGLVVDTYIY